MLLNEPKVVAWTCFDERAHHASPSTDRRSMATDCRLVCSAQTHGPTAAESSYDHQRHSLDSAHRFALRDLPEAFGPWATVWDLFDRFNAEGMLVAILDRLRNDGVINEELWCIDGTIIRAAHCASGGGKKIRTSPMTTRLAEAAAV